MKRYAWLMLVGMTGLAGCAGRLTMDNYEQLEVGMARDRVESILGEPSHCSGAAMVASCRWGSGRRFIQAQFIGDKAITYQYQGLK
ncbi:hypothetical protein [Halomonas sp. WWR20]